LVESRERIIDALSTSIERHASAARERARNAREHKPEKKRMPKRLKDWIEQRALQRYEDERRCGARRIWEELRDSFATGEWKGVADAPPTYEETRLLVKGVRGRTTP
jgi:hypothetical protein